MLAERGLDDFRELALLEREGLVRKRLNGPAAPEVSEIALALRTRREIPIRGAPDLVRPCARPPFSRSPRERSKNPFALSVVFFVFPRWSYS